MTTTDTRPAPPPGFLYDRDGDLRAESNIKPAEALEDQVATDLGRRALRIQKFLATFKTRAFQETAALLETLNEKHNVKKGGKKGGAVFYSFDGTFKVVLQNSDRLAFSAELQAARALLSEYLDEVTSEASIDLRSLVGRAFQIDGDGNCNVSDVMRLLSYNIAHPKWIAAMKAVKESIRVVGTASYIRFYQRNEKGEYVAISLDLAKL
ncbi:MAG: DUF3164 family protein [Rhodospirillaceae bacterium]|nr:DUF3164 family protein [Rhodospirillales bacterium]